MIADFVIDKMSAYIAGGMRPETAARSTIRELSAIYRGRHWSRDAAGAMRPTPLPENIAPEEAGAICKAAINDILKNCKENAETKKHTHSTAPEKEKNPLSGFEKMAEYAGKETT
jgi:hypothetical protein